MIRSRVIQLCMAVVALAAPVGVASAGTTEPGDSTPTSDTESTEAAESTEAGESGPPSASAPSDTSEADDSPNGPPPGDIDFQIDMMLGLVPQEEMEEYWNQQNEERELQTQQCMNEAGFEYEPMDSGNMSFDQYNGLTQLEWAQQYGYGMWTTMDPENQDAYGDQGMSDWPGDAVNNMSPDDQNAWWGLYDICNTEAYESSDDPWSNPMVQQIMEDFNTDVENDPRVRDALETWQSCMADAGHPFANQEELFEAVYGGDDNQEMWDLQSQFFESEAWLDTSPDHAEWQTLVDQEIEIAVADATCTPPMTEVREEVTKDLRTGLVDVWQTIDWSLPPVTYEDMGMFPGETVVEDSTEVPDTNDAGESEGTAAATTEAQVGLDLGDPTATTEP